MKPRMKFLNFQLIALHLISLNTFTFLKTFYNGARTSIPTLVPQTTLEKFKKKEDAN